MQRPVSSWIAVRPQQSLQLRSTIKAASQRWLGATTSQNPCKANNKMLLHTFLPILPCLIFLLCSTATLAHSQSLLARSNFHFSPIGNCNCHQGCLSFCQLMGDSILISTYSWGIIELISL